VTRNLNRLIQHLIDRRLEEKSNLIESGKSVSPLEAELQRLKEEIEAATLFCNEAKQSWLKYQNEYIVLLEDRSNARSTLTDLSRKEVIMQEKNSKLQQELQALEHNVNVDVRRRIESLHSSILRLAVKLIYLFDHFFSQVGTHNDNAYYLSFDNSTAINKFLKTLHPGGIRTRDLLFCRWTRSPPSN
jgi:hypothetical protein